MRQPQIIIPKPTAVYRTAQICPNGHLISKDISNPGYPSEEFCSKCGALTIKACPTCNSPIRGNCQIGINVEYLAGIPAHCHNCGKPFPWTSGAIEAAQEYAAEATALSPAEKAALKTTITELTTDTARTPMAVSRFKKFMTTAGPEAAKALTQILVSVITEEAKKQLGLK